MVIVLLYLYCCCLIARQFQSDHMANASLIHEVEIWLWGRFKSECDVTSVVGALVVFALPLTLLIPDFSLWDVVPKVRVTRFHILSQHLSWSQMNAAAIGLLAIFFCIYLEIRKRKLDDMVESVLRVGQATDASMEVERARQAAAVRACVTLLDASAEHYEHLALLRDELRQRDAPRVLHHPPAIEPSTSDVVSHTM